MSDEDREQRSLIEDWLVKVDDSANWSAFDLLRNLERELEAFRRQTFETVFGIKVTDLLARRPVSVDPFVMVGLTEEEVKIMCECPPSDDSQAKIELTEKHARIILPDGRRAEFELPEPVDPSSSEAEMKEHSLLIVVKRAEPHWHSVPVE